MSGKSKSGDAAPAAPAAQKKAGPARTTGSQRWAVIVMLIVVTVISAAAMGHVWVRLRIVRMGYELSREASRSTRLERLHQKLAVEHSLLRNPQRIEELARRQLGLRTPKPGEVQLIRQGSGLFGLKTSQKH
jgi:cell division protein FtsL